MILEQLRKYAELKQSEKVLLNEIAYLKKDPEPARSARLIRSLQNIVRRLESAQRQTEQLINAETDPTARKIMDLHYIQGKPWEEVCQILFGYPDRFYCYRTIARNLKNHRSDPLNRTKTGNCPPCCTNQRTSDPVSRNESDNGPRSEPKMQHRGPAEPPKPTETAETVLK